MVKKLRMSKDEMAAYDYAKEVAVKQMQASCLSLMLKGASMHRAHQHN